MLSGLIAATSYNRFCSTKLPQFLDFFSGKRCVAIVTACFSFIAVVILYLVWSLIYNGLVALGEDISYLGAFGAGLYAFLNRLLIPFGMHHALNSVFWFDVAGISDLTKFWSSKGTFGITGMYMTGFFHVMMFGLPAAAFAMYKAAKADRKKKVFAILASTAFCSFFTGVTEPLEFAFMFLAPGLYFIYAVLTGITAMITVMLPIRVGFCFSAGFLDLAFSSNMPLAQNPWLILAIGIVVALVYYFVFYYAIIKFNLKTPGREDKSTVDTKVEDQNTDQEFAAMAQKILEGLGGKENLVSLDNCITRLRLEITDPAKVNYEMLKDAGARGVVKKDTAVQVIIGTQVQFVADEMKKLI